MNNYYPQPPTPTLRSNRSIVYQQQPTSSIFNMQQLQQTSNQIRSFSPQTSRGFQSNQQAIFTIPIVQTPKNERYTLPPKISQLGHQISQILPSPQFLRLQSQTQTAPQFQIVQSQTLPAPQFQKLQSQIQQAQVQQLNSYQTTQPNQTQAKQSQIIVLSPQLATNQSNMFQTNNLQQPQNVTMSFENLKVEQPSQVVDLKQFEEKWQLKFSKMESSFSKIQPEKVVQEKVVYFQDDQKLKEYENEIEALKNDIDSYSDENTQLQQDLAILKQDLIKSQIGIKSMQNDHSILDMEKENLQVQLTSKEVELNSKKRLQEEVEQKLNQVQKELRDITADYDDIKFDHDKLKTQQRENQKELNSMTQQFGDLKARLYEEVKSKDKQLKQYQDEIYDLKDNNDEQNQKNQQFEDKNQFLHTEISNWKQKFIDLNRQYNQTREDLTMASAELEQIKKESLKVDKTPTTRHSQRQSSNRQSTLMQNSRNTSSPRNSEKSVLNETDLAKIQSYVKK